MTGTAGDFSRRSHNARGAAMRTARRHSLIVRILRIVLPSTALAAVLIIIASMVLDPRVQLAVQVDAESVGVSGSRIVMQRPRLTGYDAGAGPSSKRGYEVTAARAEQDMAKANEVDLFELEARMSLRANGWAEI